jgi:hypothetical protein
VVVAVVRDTAGINARLSVVLAPQTSKDKTVIRFVGSRHMIQCSPWFVVQLAASLVWVNIRCNTTVHEQASNTTTAAPRAKIINPGEGFRVGAMRGTTYATDEEQRTDVMNHSSSSHIVVRSDSSRRVSSCLNCDLFIRGTRQSRPRRHRNK